MVLIVYGMTKENLSRFILVRLIVLIVTGEPLVQECAHNLVPCVQMVHTPVLYNRLPVRYVLQGPTVTARPTCWMETPFSVLSVQQELMLLLLEHQVVRNVQQGLMLMLREHQSVQIVQPVPFLVPKEVLYVSIVTRVAIQTVHRRSVCRVRLEIIALVVTLYSVPLGLILQEGLERRLWMRALHVQ
jgi:hypothetical protein